ncbi:MarR family transcriptional regulator [Gordonibacter sp. ResAG-26]|uniref:MarR family transcriptional regulator n=2 Tax=Gordonibacter urolithinfaciens TaxID=1335613 RepID=A0A6N8IG18_9ACTN|nr:MarR family transcriptional regulator [Gordonibacter urolithinfaciens]MVM53395.1 MarR family transcriptional regulator [Gordonibacter urolithinfaciens]MVN13793.1 MarR family transcriptional regulator [Gordonibacter urolithinfaciens]MVN37395.1 MarR family transcriptional regulator [Gordonibacter urolithinfaciens]MVN54731.1 MarR family transcriptional regulator [Gordonibacter urolithinfaciens]MVN60017.1 MarR family transcriptional regulator [Gordonibacter urolithinfaciens]
MQKLLHDTVAPVCQQNGLTLQQMHVLLELVGTPGQTSTQLSERAGILRTNFSSVCHKLEERGLVERRRSDCDRRAFELRATDEGRELLARIDADIKRRYGAAFENEPPETFETILAGFRALSAFAAKLGR